MVYKWKHHNYPADAQQVGEYINNVSREVNITPGVLVDLARDKSNILHPCFTWDDETAAEKYREGEARSIIGNLVFVESEDSKAEPVRAFVHYVEDDTEQEVRAYYMPTHQAMQDEKVREYVMQQALKELEAFRRKYGHLKQFAKVFDAVDEIQLQVT